MFPQYPQDNEVRMKELKIRISKELPERSG